MFATDPEAAAAEIRRVTRPGGRVAVAVWGPRARNPWLGLVFDAVEAHTGSPVPPPGVRGPFSLDDADRLARLLVAAGLADVRVEEVEVPLAAASPDEWWDRATALAGPLALRLARMSGEESDELRARAREAARPYASAGGLLMPGLSLVASGRRAMRRARHRAGHVTPARSTYPCHVSEVSREAEIRVCRRRGRRAA